MNKPMAICLEDLETKSEETRYLCCSVNVGIAPGLSIDNKGTTRWLVNKDISFHLVVTLDDRLALYRVRGGAQVKVKRAGRSIEAPFEKPVILKQKDELMVSGRSYKVHTHGHIEKTYEPFFFTKHIKTIGKTAAALALSASLGTAGCYDVDRIPGPLEDSDITGDTSAETQIETSTTDESTSIDTGIDSTSGTDTGFDTGTDTGFDIDTMTDSDTQTGTSIEIEVIEQPPIMLNIN